MNAETKPRETKVIAVGNQKGGVGKSTNTVNLAAALGELGRRSLVVDLDANCGATRALGVPTSFLGTFEALLGEESAADLIIKTDAEEGVRLPRNVDLLPGHRRLEEIDRVFRERRENKFKDPTDALLGPLQALRGNYDYIFLDTAPNASSPTIAAYKSANWFILSMTPDKLALEALLDALTDIVAVRDAGNPNLRLLGVVLTLVDKRTRIASEYAERIRKDFEAAGHYGPFMTQISRAVVVPQSYESGLALVEFAPDHMVTEQYRELAREVESRIAQLAIDTQTPLQPEVQSQPQTQPQAVPAPAAQPAAVVGEPEPPVVEVKPQMTEVSNG